MSSLALSVTISLPSPVRSPSFDIFDRKTFLKKEMGQPRPLFHFVHFFCLKQTIQLLQQINVKNTPSSIRRWDRNTFAITGD